MKISLSERIRKPTLIIGFPGVGLIGPIVTEFLINHMKTKQVGTFEYDELPATAAIHKGKLVHPMSLHYSKAHNTLILYTILNVHDHEWDVAKQIKKLADELKVKEIICVDGANTMGTDGDQVFTYGNNHFLPHGCKVLEESVITGVTGALLLSLPKTTCLFASAEGTMPNSKAAAEVVKVLDKHLKLDVDYHPLLKQAELFEEKLQSVNSQSQQALSEQQKKNLDYLG